MSEKIYCGKAKKKTTEYGEMFSVSMSKSDVASISENMSESGWVHLTMVKRREPDTNGNDYYFYMFKKEAPIVKEIPEDDIPF